MATPTKTALLKDRQETFTLWLNRRLKISDKGCIKLKTLFDLFQEETGMTGCNNSPATYGRLIRKTFPDIRRVKRKCGSIYFGIALRDSDDCTDCNSLDKGFIQKPNDDNNVMSFLYIMPNVSVNDMEVIVHIDWHREHGRLKIMAFDQELNLSAFDIPAVIEEHTLPAVFRIIRSLQLCRGFDRIENSKYKTPSITTATFQIGNNKTERQRTSACLRFLRPTQTGEACEKCSRRRSNLLLCQDDEPNTISLQEEDHKDMVKMFEALRQKLEGRDDLHHLLKSQLLQLQQKDIIRCWHPKIIHLCLTLWNRSERECSRQGHSGFLVLPSGRRLKFYKRSVHHMQRPGKDEELKWMMKAAVEQGVPPRQCIAGVVSDEKKIEEDFYISYRGKKAVLVGFVDDIKEEADSPDNSTEDEPEKKRRCP